MKRFLVKAFIIIYARGSQPTGRNQIAKLKLVHWYIFLESIELNKTTFLFSRLGRLNAWTFIHFLKHLGFLMLALWFKLQPSKTPSLNISHSPGKMSYIHHFSMWVGIAPVPRTQIVDIQGVDCISGSSRRVKNKELATSENSQLDTKNRFSAIVCIFCDMDDNWSTFDGVNEGLISWARWKVLWYTRFLPRMV